ncbi:urocortin 3, like [Paralichthys olivaceus]|uniref:urocortin 3, like n=1 Tax=Paralichthys olivaceus TaxID=8255 RepID=UPI003753E7CA
MHGGDGGAGRTGGQTVRTADLHTHNRTQTTTRTHDHTQDLSSSLLRISASLGFSFLCRESSTTVFFISGHEWGASMLSSLKTLLLLSVLCAPTSSLCLRLYHSRSDLLCDNQLEEPGYSPVEDWGSLLQSAEYLSSSSSSSSSSSAESSRGKRTSSPANYRFMSRTKLRGQMLRNSSKGDRRSRLTLSLDVPTNIMNVLFDVAKAKNLRAKAAENARLLAQIGRRK